MKADVTLGHDWFPQPLPENVVIGARSWLYSSFSFLHYQSRRPCGVRIGHDTGIYNGTFFDLGPDGEVEIGNYCALVGAIISTNARVLIGDYSFIGHEVVLADSFASVPPSRSSPPGDTQISLGENCWIGARAILLAGSRIGENAVVGAASVVDFEVPAGATVVGNPARIVGRG